MLLVEENASSGCTKVLDPLVPVRVRKSAGLRWPVDGMTLAPGVKIGTSNQALGGKVMLEPEGPGLLVILPAERLPDLVAAYFG